MTSFPSHTMAITGARPEDIYLTRPAKKGLDDKS